MGSGKSNTILASPHLLGGSDLKTHCSADRRRVIPKLVQSEVRLVDNANVCHCLSSSQPSRHLFVVRFEGQSELAGYRGMQSTTRCFRSLIETGTNGFST